MAFTCPRCRRTSHHPGDARQGYCGACRDWTASALVYQCAACGLRAAVPPFGSTWWCPCGAPGPVQPGDWSSGEVTVSRTDCGFPGADCAGRPPEADDGSWEDAMEWLPGDAEW